MNAPKDPEALLGKEVRSYRMGTLGIVMFEGAAIVWEGDLDPEVYQELQEESYSWDIAKELLDPDNVVASGFIPLERLVFWSVRKPVGEDYCPFLAKDQPFDRNLLKSVLRAWVMDPESTPDMTLGVHLVKHSGSLILNLSSPGLRAYMAPLNLLKHELEVADQDFPVRL